MISNQQSVEVAMFTKDVKLDERSCQNSLAAAPIFSSQLQPTLIYRERCTYLLYVFPKLKNNLILSHFMKERYKKENIAHCTLPTAT